MSLSLLLVFALTGCANSRYGPQTTVVNNFPDCYQPIADMRASEFIVEESTVGGALAGALLGALIGYAADGGRGAAIGATVGGVAGAAIGHQYGRIAQERDNATRLSMYTEQLVETHVGMDATTAAASLARQCYEQQFGVAVDEYRAGYITKDQFRERYIEVASGMEEASRILGMAIDDVTELSVAYNEALYEESARLGVNEVTVVEMRDAARVNVQQTSGQQPAKPTQSAAAKPPAKPTARPATGLDQDLDERFNTMVENGVAVENSLDNARSEQELINARLDLANQVAEDILS